MEISALQAFLAVAESASFTEASERLFLTQPAVSKRIAALEAELGRPLFDRIQRRVELTEAGRALLPHARTILRQVAESRRAVADLSGAVSGELHIGTSHHIGLHRLPGPLREYSTRYPEVQLDIRFLDSETACRAVEQGELELAVVTLPLEAHARLRTTALWHDALAVCCAREHPLAGHHQVALSELAAHPAILPGRGTFTREVIEAAFSGLALKVGLSTNYLETNKMLIGTGLGWGVLPSSMLDDELLQLDTPLRLSRELGLVQHIDRHPSNAAQAMVTLLLAHADSP